MVLQFVASTAAFPRHPGTVRRCWPQRSAGFARLVTFTPRLFFSVDFRRRASCRGPARQQGAERGAVDDHGRRRRRHLNLAYLVRTARAVRRGRRNFTGLGMKIEAPVLGSVNLPTLFRDRRGTCRGVPLQDRNDPVLLACSSARRGYFLLNGYRAARLRTYCISRCRAHRCLRNANHLRARRPRRKLPATFDFPPRRRRHETGISRTRRRARRTHLHFDVPAICQFVHAERQQSIAADRPKGAHIGVSRAVERHER